MLEEVLDGFTGEFRDVENILNVIPPGVTCWDGYNLGVAATIVGHVEDSDGPGREANAGKQGIFRENEDIDGVAIQAQGVLKKAVVSGVNKVCVEHAVEKNPTGFMVDLILVAAPARDFNDGGVFGHGVYSFEEGFVK